MTSAIKPVKPGGDRRLSFSMRVTWGGRCVSRLVLRALFVGAGVMIAASRSRGAGLQPDRPGATSRSRPSRVSATRSSALRGVERCRRRRAPRHFLRGHAVSTRQPTASRRPDSTIRQRSTMRIDGAEQARWRVVADDAIKSRPTSASTPCIATRGRRSADDSSSGGRSRGARVTARGRRAPPGPTAYVPRNPGCGSCC